MSPSSDQRQCQVLHWPSALDFESRLGLNPGSITYCVILGKCPSSLTCLRISKTEMIPSGSDMASFWRYRLHAHLFLLHSCSYLLLPLDCGPPRPGSFSCWCPWCLLPGLAQRRARACLLRAELCLRRLPVCPSPHMAYSIRCMSVSGAAVVLAGAPESSCLGSDSAVPVFSSRTWESLVTQLKSEPRQCGCLITAQSD